MTTLNIDLPDGLKRFVEEEAARTGNSPSAYVESLIREEQRRAAREAIEQKLIEGLDSGSAGEMTPQTWQDLRRRLDERIKARE